MIDPSKSIQALLFSEIRASCQSVAYSNTHFNDRLHSARRPQARLVIIGAPAAVLSVSGTAGRQGFFPGFPPVIEIYPANAADRISHHIRHFGIT